MATFLVSVPFSLTVTIDAASADEIDEEMVEKALLDEYGKYAEIDIRDAGADLFEVLDEA
jgi:hypothetical protein